MELEWLFVNYLSGTRRAIRRTLSRAGFGSACHANIQLAGFETRRVLVCRRQSDVRPVTIRKNLEVYGNGHQALRLMFFGSELVIDDQENLCIDDELRHAVLNFI
ncbi:hypothetical protein AAVH_15552 [Aphelenchoides avenae]|nr:hypothetical protein AAVH_15552 [Aphelenchus avenae]